MSRPGDLDLEQSAVVWRGVAWRGVARRRGRAARLTALFPRPTPLPTLQQFRHGKNNVFVFRGVRGDFKEKRMISWPWNSGIVPFFPPSELFLAFRTR